MSDNSIELSPEDQDRDEKSNANDRVAKPEKPKTVDPRDIVRTEGNPADIRDAVESPMVTPQMVNEPGDLRRDLMQED